MILHLILQFLHHFQFQYLAAAAGVGLADLGGSAGPIIDAGGGGGDIDPSPDGGGDDVDDPAGDGAAQTEVEAGAAGKTEGDSSKVDWRTIPSDVRAHIQEITKTNPKLGNMLQNAVYTSQTFLREVPEGLKGIKALKASIEEVGGIAEVKTLQATHKQFVEEQEIMDSQARSGNPAVIDNLIEIAGDGFTQLMPTAMAKWAAKDPLGYQYETSKLMVDALKNGGVVADLNMAFRMLKLNTPEAIKEGIDCLTRIGTFFNGMNTTATTTPERPKVDPKIAQEQQNIDNQKAQMFNQEFSNEFGAWRTREIRSEVTKISNGRQLTDYQVDTLGQRVVDDIRLTLTADEEYMKSLRKLYDARDKSELLKFTKARTAKLLPEAIKTAYRHLFSSGPSKVKKPVVATTPAAAAVAVKGWTKVDPTKAPSPDEIDGKKTPFDMKFKKQAILKDGRKVYWGTSIPA